MHIDLQGLTELVYAVAWLLLIIQSMRRSRET